ncbi:MAG: hypothetical protein WBD74_00380 [Candidatus Aquilonibacter sp.]
MKRPALSVFFALVFVATSLGVGLAAPPSISGTWVVQQTGRNGNSTSQITLTQSGNQVVGTNTASKNGFTGEFVSDTQINGKWHGPGGAGWLTVYVTPNGHSFNGTWGYNGRSANGSFVANEVLPPSPLTAAGSWNVYGAGGPSAFVGAMRCTESGRAVVCHTGPILINGAFNMTEKDKVNAKWTSPQGSGWFSFWFNGDNNSFNGVWGNGANTTPPIGRVVGQRQLK